MNHSWNAGTGDVTDSYNVSYNETWLNGTINSFNHTGLSAHAWSNITVYAYNATDSTISLGASDNVQIQNNAVSVLNVTDITVSEGDNVTFDINSTDADGDTPVFDCNNSALFDTFNTSTGEGLWITDLTDAGTYYVEFDVSDGYGSVDYQVMTITINEVITLPVANFSANTVTGYAPLSVQFTDNSGNNPTAWFWDFGDDTNSSQQNPTHTYSATGTYNVCLSASNLAGSNISSNMAITVTAAPSSGSSHSGGSGSSGKQVIREADESNESEESTGDDNAEGKSTKHIESVNFETNSGGETLNDVTVWSSEETAYLSISTGTKVTDASGGSVNSIRIVDIPVSDIPEMEDAMTLHAYECTPDGTTFSPAIHLTFALSEEEWEQYGESAKVGWYNDDTGEWEIIQGTADASTRTITIQASHFSTYALFGDNNGELTGTQDTGSQGGMSMSWLWILLLLAIVGGAGYCITQINKKE
ncbi:PKD domain-containing protein [uncultured Methanomethylovorans sp.]|uniref:PKD domain-containing protein n=1 Tax=uncultured Methanomethylovorans sp. TaxID=183759 RepID=UPI002AA81528|nr:PKD domain-containing protein [uncultured Methanomethylovorans sp.]